MISRRQNILRASAVAAVAAVSSAWTGELAAEEIRQWTARGGAPFEAALVAADGMRATLDVPQRGKAVVALGDLAPADAEYARSWRGESRRRPLIDPARLAPWPAQAGEPGVEVRLTGESAGNFVYESAQFRFLSEVKLPAGTVRELAAACESTRALLIALPLGLHAGGERGKYNVHLAANTDSYRQLGGAEGSGGFFDPRGRRMLLLLPNLGIEQRSSGLVLAHQRQLFIVRHEVTHQLLAEWHAPWPFWLHEGFAEWVAALPYAQDRYSLHNPGAGLYDYVLKWRGARDSRVLRLVPPARLMAMSPAEWQGAVQQTAAYDLYNSAALLTWYFLQQDGGRPLAAFIDALRRRIPAEEAERAFLLKPGQTRETLAAEVVALGKRLGFEVKPAP